ncbi:MAG: selenocysteine-specific elongation factor [Clostridia bacterium]|nr:selenocysteine-specific elongation factor [Clostridia bacterium]
MDEYLIVGTAGHIDHGKTALVKALTGVDTDRLKEEKERGISIELGFAPLILPGGRRLGLVDVPGHERFIKHMLAGVGGIDLALLVIAADEGVMPQTREHLYILDLLQVKQGIIVLTKIDLVDEEWLELVEEEARQLVQGTVLDGAPIVKVSALTGEGIPELLRAIAAIAAITPSRQPSGKVRLPIDRVFSISGFGTVVTGTLWSGTIRPGEEIEILPQGLRNKVRGLQVHGETVKEAKAGQRVAVNLVGVEVQDIKRGNVLVEPGFFTPTQRLDASLRLLKDVPSLANRTPVHFYLGTSEVLGRVILLDKDELKGGDSGLVQILLEGPVVAARGDRFVIRSFSPLVTIGGGLVLAAHPPRHRRFQAEVITALQTRLTGNAREIVAGVIKESKGVLTENEVARKAELLLEEVRDHLQDLAAAGEIILFKEEGLYYALAAGCYRGWVAKVTSSLEDYHRKFPLRRGLPKEELRTRFFPRLDIKPFQGFLKQGASEGYWRLEGNDVFLPEFEVKLSPELARAYQNLIDTFRRGWWQPPTWAEAIARLNINERDAEELLHYASRQGTLVRLSEDLYLHSEALEAAKEQIRRLAANGPVTLGEVRDALGSSRKYVLPLLEYLDQIKFTKRIGDKRVVIGLV